MDDMTAFEHQVVAQIRGFAGPPRPVDVAVIFDTVTSTKSSKSRLQTLFSATRFVAAGAIVALFGGLLLATVLTHQQGDDSRPIVGASPLPEPVVTPTLPIMLPPQIPDGVATGTLDTPLGPARWVHLRGDDTTLPASLDPVAGPSGGYISLEWDNTPPRLWRSPDLITWASEPLPIEARWGGLTVVDETLWVSAAEPVSLWSSVDALEWTEASLDGLEAPGPDGSAWRLDLGTALAYDGVTIVPTTYYPDHQVVSRALGRTDQSAVFVFESEPGVYTLADDRRERTLATVRFEDTGSDLLVIDTEDGAELALLDGISMEFIDLLASGEVHAVHGLGILTEDGPIEVDLPDSMDQEDAPVFLVDDAGFVAFGRGRDGLVHVHRSTDGRVWIETDLVGDDPGEPTDIVGVYDWQGPLVIETEPHETLWTTDGMNWESRHPLDNFGGAPIGSAWISFQGVHEGVAWHAGDVAVETMWFAPHDGGVPVAVDVSDVSGIDLSGATPSGQGEPDSISSNTVVSVNARDEGARRRDIWIITFDDVPA